MYIYKTKSALSKKNNNHHCTNVLNPVNKQVKFATIVNIVLIPCINEYKAANLYHDIWGSLNPYNLDLRNSHDVIISGES